MASKKFYWLKLKRDFFKRHDIRIIEEMTNGKDYILFYLKLLLESIDHEGSLRFSDAIPYNEQMLSVVTNTNVDIVKAAMNLFIELNMIDVLDDQTIYMTEVEKLIGSETDSAKRMRDLRTKQKALDSSEKTSQCDTDVTPMLENVTQSKSKRIEKEIDIELDVDVEKESDDSNGNGTENVDNSVDNSPLEYMGGTLGKGVVLLSQAQRDVLLDELGFDAFNHYVKRLATFIIDKQANVKNHYETIRKWAKEDSMI